MFTCRPTSTAPLALPDSLPEGYASSVAPRALPTLRAEALRSSPAVRACDTGTCFIDTRFDRPEHQRAPAKTSTWVLEPATTLRVERDESVDVLAMVVAGAVHASTLSTRASRGSLEQDERAEAWSAVRSAGEGLALYVDRADPPAAVVIVVARDAPPTMLVHDEREERIDGSDASDASVPASHDGGAAVSDARAQSATARDKGARPAARTPSHEGLIVRSLADVPWLSWSGGMFRAKLVFEGATAPRASLGVLVGAARGPVAEHVHEHSYELLTAIVADGMVRVLGATEGDLGHHSVVRPGDPQVIAAGLRHAWIPAGTLPLVAVQAYAPAGPEQRFRAMAR